MTRVYRISCPAYWLNEPFRLAYVDLPCQAVGDLCVRTLLLSHTTHDITLFPQFVVLF